MLPTAHHQFFSYRTRPDPPLSKEGIKRDKRAAVAVLRFALQLLQRGWCQGTMRKGDRYCLLAALTEAAQQFHVTGRTARDRMSQAIGGNGSLSMYNDHGDRTHAEILAAVERAIDDELHQG